MKPTWLIERGVYGEHAEALRAEVQRQGMSCAEVDYRPAKQPPDDLFGCPALTDDACVILWGTLNSFSCSGLYDCDLPAVVSAARGAAEKERHAKQPESMFP